MHFRLRVAQLALFATVAACGDEPKEGSGEQPSTSNDATIGDGAAVSDATPDALVLDAYQACPSGCPIETQGYCSELPVSPLLDFEATLTAWRTDKCPAQNGEFIGGFPFLVEGTCSSGGRVLYSGTGLSIERRFYTSDGGFEALQTGSDAVPPGCNRRWPTPITCGAAYVTRIVCGGALQLGASIAY